MAKKVGKRTMLFTKVPSIISYASTVGKKELEGPLREYFDHTNSDTKFGQDNWEKAETKLQEITINKALEKAKLELSDIDYLFAGDLLNQCIASSFNARQLNIPFIGLYGACSTMAESLAMASVFIDNNSSEYTVAMTSSHFCTAERQYRLPLEYGGQRPPTAQWTVTGSGCCVLGSDGDGPYIKGVSMGSIVDLGVKDPNNMGAAMAPACCDTLVNFFNDTKTKPSDYDAIFTGDLGQVGSDILKDIIKRDGYDIDEKHNDCGLLIYDCHDQDVHAGGSGCGCSASVLNSLILGKMRKKELNNILFVATGALLSLTSSQQGESIPSIAHLIYISNNKEVEKWT